jgi:HEAT repeat protein
MSALTSLLARDQVVAVRKIEEALQKQVISGGDIGAVLLELDAIPENILAAYGAALYGRLPATRDEVMRAPRDVVRVVPREVAEKHRLVPVALDAMASGAAGPTLIVALSMPLSQEVEQQLSFLLGHTLVSRVICEVRVAAALSHHYGVEPAPRMRRLIDKLRERDAGPVPYVAPPETGKLQSNQLAGLGKKSSAASFLDDDEPDEVPTPASVPPKGRPSGVPPGRTTDPLGVTRDQTVVDPLPSAPPPKVKTQPPPRPVSVAPAALPRIELVQSSRRAWIPPEPSRPEIDPLPALQKHRGPLSASQAVQLLESASKRDEILEILLSFAGQFFDYVAAFTVQDDNAEGRVSVGAGTGTGELRAVKIALGPTDAARGLLAESRAALMPLAGPLDGAETELSLATDLGQPLHACAIVVPIVLRSRAVLLVVGVRSTESFTVSDVPELVAFAPRVVDALERLILRKKQGKAPPPAKMVATVDPTDRAALKAAVRDARASAPPRALTRSSDRWSSVPQDERRSAAPAARVDAPPSPIAIPDRSTFPGVGTETGSSPPVRSLADAILDGADTGTPLSKPSPVAAVSRARNPLNIPRSVPPPPDSAFVLPVVDLPPRDSVGRLTSEFGGLRGRMTEPAPAPVAPVPVVVVAEPDDEPELSIAENDAPDDDDDDDEPELSIGDNDDDDDDDDDERDWNDEEDDELEGRTTLPTPAPYVAPSSIPPPAVLISPPSVAADVSNYSMHDLEEEVVIPLKRPRAQSGLPTPASRSASTPPTARVADPRREEGGAQSSADRVAPEAVERVRTQAANPPVVTRSSVTPREMPSVIVDMGDAVENLVLDLQHAGPDDERAAVNALLRLGEAALPVLAQTFPGPLWFDRHRPHRRTPRGRDTSAIARAFYAFGVRATPYVATLTSNPHPERRYYALLLAGDMVHPSLLDAVSARVFDEDESIRKLAHEIVPRFGGLAGWNEQLVLVRRAAKIRGKDPKRRLHALSALGAMRDAGSLRLLVELLEDDDRDVVRHAHLTLIALTAEDLGPSPRKWSAWADKNEGRHRIEWLIDALTHTDEALRTDAGDELKQLTQQYFGFHPGTTRREREVAQGKYRQWWQAEGKKQFG